MEQWIHLAKTLYMQYTMEIIVGILSCLVILMIITLFTVRRCKKQVKHLSENTKDFMKYSLQPNSVAEYRGRDREISVESGTSLRERGVTKEDEEIFGSVIQEMFS